MFTSRAEFRLHLRADNADQRLTPLAMVLGCVDDVRTRRYSEKMERLSAARAGMEARTLTPNEAGARGFAVNMDGVRRSLLDLLAYPQVDAPALVQQFPELAGFGPDIIEQLQNDARYAPYLARQAQDAERLLKDEAVHLPDYLDYLAMDGLSSELRGKLDRVRPRTLGQASRIEGMTPAALTLVLLRARRAQLVGSA
jgi:tRNA uridine 5-carboxymethylaminomethyl modification enzyme